MNSAEFLVVVVGSINHDVVAELERFPHPGETLTASAIRHNVGGKGANQAVAAQRFAATAMVAAVGDDDEGRAVIRELAGTGVDTTGVSLIPDVATGTAFIQVARGENSIVLDGGANRAYGDLSDAQHVLISHARIVVCQMEISNDAIAAASAHAHRFVLNAAPAQQVSPEVIRRCDPLVVNEHELAVLSSMPTTSIDEAFAAARHMLANGAMSVVVTLGERGAIWVTDNRNGQVAAPPMEAVDSTGAGDAFVGALAARLALGDTLDSAVRWGVAAGSLAVTRPGTHAAYGGIDDVEQVMAAMGTVA